MVLARFISVCTFSVIARTPRRRARGATQRAHGDVEQSADYDVDGSPRACRLEDADDEDGRIVGRAAGRQDGVHERPGGMARRIDFGLAERGVQSCDALVDIARRLDEPVGIKHDRIARGELAGLHFVRMIAQPEQDAGHGDLLNGTVAIAHRRPRMARACEAERQRGRIEDRRDGRRDAVGRMQPQRLLGGVEHDVGIGDDERGGLIA